MSLAPTAAQEPVVLVFAANDHYVPYLSVLVSSIAAHATVGRPYELLVLSEDLTEEHQAVLAEQLAGTDLSLRFLDVNEAMAPYQDKLSTHGHFRMETYFRLLLPQLLPEQHKVLYLDADMVCLRDVAELFDTDLDDFLIAACHDPDTTGLYNGSPVAVEQDGKKEYMDQVLRIERPYDYFQAGTILFNLDEWRARIDVDEVFRFAQSYEWHLLDQDVLNYFCQGSVRFVDMAWNVMFDWEGIRIRDIISYTTPELRDAYHTARKNPAIVHYAGPSKPWDDPECDFATAFWHHARSTPFYEVILHRMSNTQLAREIAQVRAEIEDTRAWIKGVDEYLHAVDAELLRFERRPVGLMAKEFVFQKVLRPLSNLLARTDEDRARLERLYRAVHPRRTPTSKTQAS